MISQFAIDPSHHFQVIGLSHWTADVEKREKFSISEERIEALLQEAHRLHLKGLFALSTCNRTEIYGFTDNTAVLKELLFRFSNGTDEEFEQVGFVKHNHDAFHHLFDVSAGLESQILGDFQIIGQIKSAFQIAQNNHTANAEITRLVNQVIKSNKKIKSTTNLSVGAASISYAAVQYLKSTLPTLAAKKVLLYGVGKIGKIVCKNLLKNNPQQDITLINRTFETGKEVADQYGLKIVEHDALSTALNEADIIITATAAVKPVVTKASFGPNQGGSHKVLIDLSVPRNIADDVESIDGFEVINLDHLNDMQTETLEKRKGAIPQARQIIHENMMEYYEWLEVRKISPTIKALKGKLNGMRMAELEQHKTRLAPEDYEKMDAITSRIVNNITKQCIAHLKENIRGSEDSLHAIQSMFDLKIK